MPITQVITALPDAPDPANDTPTLFNMKAAASVLAQKGLPTEINAFGTQANALAASVATDAATATAGAATATTQAAAAVSGVNAIAWVSGTTYTDGQARYSPIDRRTYRRIGGGAGTTDPSADAVNWVLISQAAIVPQKISRSARTSNTVLTSADSTTFIDITSGSFTQTFAAVAALGAGWYCYLRNSGTGDITLDPNASELVDGLTSYVMYPGEARLVQCDGTQLTSIVLQGYRRDFTSSGTWVKPPGYKTHSGLAWSAGCSGGKGTGLNDPQGGSGGGCFPFVLNSSDLAASETVTIGAGGAPVTTAATVGNTGGDTSFGSWISVAGATFTAGGTVKVGGAAISTTTQPVGFNTVAATATLYGGTTPSISSGPGVGPASLYGGCAGGSWNSNSGTLQAPGASTFGGSGGPCSATSSISGTDGTAPGGGGGATRTGTQSGAGARGELRIGGIQ